MSRAFRDLVVWQKAMDLTTEVYRLTDKFPKSELYALTSQLRRSAVSVPSNIAEGCGRSTKTDFAKFIAIARGSNYELETQLLISVRLRYVDEATATNALNVSTEVGRMLRGLLLHLRKEARSGNNLTT